MKFTYKLFPDWLRNLTMHVQDPRIAKKCQYSMEQIFCCGLMVFLLRHRSLRSFCLENKDNPYTVKNLNRWLTIKGIPSDDEIRYSLQTVSTKSLNNLLREFHQKLERKKILCQQKLFARHELVVLDGTGQISSKKIHCEKCLTKTLSSGDICYYHGQLLASITNISASYSLPLQLEPIEQDDVDTEYSKNDCEINAAKRLLTKLKSQFPKRSFCFLGDNLFAVDPIVRMMKERQWHFIITAKPERNKELFFMYDYVYEKKRRLECVDSKGSIHRYCWSNGLPLKSYNKSEVPINVNLFEYEEVSSKGELIYKNSWMTDFLISKDNVRVLTKAGRNRFVIENRNFNEQKNLGFNTEHNFGHFGNLPNVFFGLAQVAQLITELFCHWKEGKLAINSIGSKRRYFERLAVMIGCLVLPEDEWPIVYLKFDFNSE
jgi:hypothetical protein